MIDGDDRQLEELRMALSNALDGGRLEDLDRDLWPRMRQRLTTPPPAPSQWDWALLAATVVVAIAFPRVLVALLYHL